ncbi:IVSP1-like protein [Lissonota sp. PSUC_FEM 10030012]|nr:IVSP1-like protein [Lissonota sp. PSUC_FEM 10030012]
MAVSSNETTTDGASPKTVEPVTPVILDSDDIEQNKRAHEAAMSKRGTMFGGFAGEIIWEYKLLSWLAACLFCFGSISNMFTGWSYIIDHSLLGAGSLIWMFYAALNRDGPTFIQHTFIFGISVYIFVKHIQVGKYAYLTAALLCTSCAVYNHQNLPNFARGSCTSLTTGTSVSTVTSNSTDLFFDDEECKLKNVMLTIEDKLKIVENIADIMHTLNVIRSKELYGTREGYSTVNITEEATSDILYLPAKKHLSRLVESLKEKKRLMYC